MSCCCIFNKEEPYIDNTETITYKPIIIYGYEEIQSGMKNICLICNEKVSDILVYCYACKSSLGHESCLKTTPIKCSGCNKDFNKSS